MAVMSTKIRLFVFLAVVIDWVASEGCDVGWRMLGDTCYHINTGVAAGTARNWHAARRYCMNQRGDLAFPKTTEEAFFLYNMSKSAYHGSVWLGLNNRQDIGTWVFSDGSTFSKSNPSWNQLWHPSQPNSDKLKRCAYQFHRTLDVCFQREDVEYVTEALESPGDCKEEDGCFNLKNMWSPSEEDCGMCERLCQLEPNCYYYTHFSEMYENSKWRKYCIGVSQDFVAGRSGVKRSHICSGSRKDVCPADGHWYNDNCGMNKGLACQKPAVGQMPTVPPTTAPSGFCPVGFSFENKCFVISERAPGQPGVTWTQALLECQSMGHGVRPTLASFHSEREQATVTMHLHDGMFGLWMGLYRVPGSDDWVWTDNSERGFNKYPYPFSGIGSVACGDMLTVPGPIGTWGLASCDSKRGFICQYDKEEGGIPPIPVEPSHPCPSGQISYRRACYQVLDKKVGWEEAQSECREIDGHLASIADGGENAAMIFHFSQDYPALWIGFHQDNDGEWRFADKHPVTFTNWGARFLPTTNNSCAAMVTHAGTWHTASCDSTSFRPLCKVNSEPVPTHPTHIEGTCPHVSDAWRQFGDSCYLFSADRKSFSDANMYCKGLGFLTSEADVQVDLASIHSLEENQFIFNELQKQHPYQTVLWIGRHMPYLNQPFIWTDGTPDQFEKYMPGEPKIEDVDNRCTRMYVLSSAHVGYWYASHCDIPYQFVCKTPKIPTESGTEIPTRDSEVEALTDGLSGGAVAGIVMGVLLCVGLLGFVGWFLFRRFYASNPADDLAAQAQASSTPTSFNNPLQYSQMQE